VAAGWRRLYNEELHNVYASPNIMVIRLRRMRWAGHVTLMGEIRNAYNIFKRIVFLDFIHRLVSQERFFNFLFFFSVLFLRHQTMDKV
jgi:hypothetical protein